MPSTYELVLDAAAGMTTIVPLEHLRQVEISICRKTGKFIKLSERYIRDRLGRF